MMNTPGKRKFRNIIEEDIASKVDLEEITKNTYRSDAAAVLESLVGEFDENTIITALENQGFAAEAYRSRVKSLATIAKERRPLRNGVANSKDATTQQKY